MPEAIEDHVDIREAVRRLCRDFPDEYWRERDRTPTLDNVIDTHVARLRKKIDQDWPVKLLHTIRGVGFVVREEAA